MPRIDFLGLPVCSEVRWFSCIPFCNRKDSSSWLYIPRFDASVRASVPGDYLACNNLGFSGFGLLDLFVNNTVVGWLSSWLIGCVILYVHLGQPTSRTEHGIAKVASKHQMLPIAGLERYLLSSFISKPSLSLDFSCNARGSLSSEKVNNRLAESS
jgi:hypothetical protein